MLVTKDDTTGLLFSPFCIGGKWLLQVAVLHYFDLLAPDEGLAEQDMWVDITPELGEGNFLDPGYPKARGEVLLAGKWHAPDGEPAPGGRVFFSVGDMRRELLVFGPRYWRAGPVGPRPSQPENVTEVPLTWQNAYGGPGFAENPHGLGHVPVLTPWGEQRRPLPLVEDPAFGLVGGPEDAPTPAAPCLAVLDAPTRTALAGTYTGDWLKTYWPGFPPDVQDDFFQLAAASQRLKQGWFQGGEQVLLEGLHPRHARVQSRLPEKRVRVFATRLIQPQSQVESPKPEESLYIEAATRLDTVWLFPGIMRGVALYRALLECADDEASDYTALFPVIESAHAPLTDLRYWHAEEEKRKAKPAPPDLAPLEEAKALVAEVSALVRTVEADAHHTVDQTLGLAPVFPVPFSQQMDLFRKTAQDALGVIADARQRMSQARKDFSHVMKIDPRSMDSARDRVLAFMDSLKEMQAKVVQGQADISRTKTELLRSLDVVEQSFSKLPYSMGQYAPDSLKPVLDAKRAILAPKPDWNSAALDLIARHMACMHEQEDIFIQAGHKQGGSARSGFGFLPAPLPFTPEDWGLESQETQETQSIPAGCLVPWFDGNKCVRLTIRALPGETLPKGPHPEGQYPADQYPESTLFAPCDEFIVPGSDEGLQVLAGHAVKPLLIVPDPMAAWLYYAEAADLFAIVVPTSPEAKAGGGAAALINEAPLALLPLSPDLFPPRAPGESLADHTEKALAAAADYASLFPNAQAVSWPAEFSAPHPAAARRKGLVIRDWLKRELETRGLPVCSAAREGGLTTEPGPDGSPDIQLTVPLPPPDLVEGLNKRIFGHTEARKQEAIAYMTAQVEKQNALLAAKGLPLVQLPETDPKAIQKLSAEQVKKDFADMDKLFADAKKVKGGEDPAYQELMDKSRAKLAEDLPIVLADVEKLKNADAIIQKELNTTMLERAPWIKDIPGAVDMLQPVPLTPALALAKMDAGDTRGLNLTDIDLSGMDFSGRVFSEMFLENVNFSGANLTGARFDKVSAQGVNFTNAQLANARFNLASFTECVFDQADCSNIQGEICSFTGCSLDSPNMRGAQLKLADFADCAFSGRIEGLKLELYSLDGAFEAVTFADCRLSKGNTLGSQCKDLLFSGGEVNQHAFIDCTGTGLRFSQAKAVNMRIVTSTIEGLVCEDTDLSDVSLRNSELASARFLACNMKNICIEYCEMPRALFEGCKAPGGVIRHSNLEEASMRRFSIPCGSLRKTRLVKADLTEANLYGADLYKTILGDSILTGANLTLTLIQDAGDILRKTGMAAE